MYRTPSSPSQDSPHANYIMIDIHMMEGMKLTTHLSSPAITDVAQ